jgi:hypothetical protein
LNEKKNKKSCLRKLCLERKKVLKKKVLFVKKP